MQFLKTFFKCVFAPALLKVVIMITFGFIDRSGVFVSDESPYFSHYACEIYVEQMLLKKVISENVAKVR